MATEFTLLHVRCMALSTTRAAISRQCLLILNIKTTASAILGSGPNECKFQDLSLYLFEMEIRVTEMSNCGPLWRSAGRTTVPDDFVKFWPI